MLKSHNPPDAMAPAGAYSQGIEVPMGAKLLFISGQVGTDATGRTGIGILEQAHMAWANLGAVLRSGGMEPKDIVKLTVYYAGSLDMNDAMRSAVNAIRSRFLGEHKPASTALVVQRLMRPDWLIEIEAVAARR
ncbi:RidA family protein [Ferrovibrio sp.]|uniref:RidA family protein n=1 Tax=Ferrovibrio sp. TaxID=1917215 RepID=UPI003D151F4C